MSAALLSSLPGDIPGLRDEGTPITVNGRDGLIVDPDARMDDGRDAVLWVDYSGVLYCDPVEAVQVRLTTRTGRAHAAWWIADESYRQYLDADLGFLHAESELLQLARSGHHMEPAQIDTLTRLCLRLAGRAS